MKCQLLFSRKNKINIITGSLSSAESAHSMVSVLTVPKNQSIHILITVSVQNIYAYQDQIWVTSREKGPFEFFLTLRLLITTIVPLEGSADSKACQTYYIPHATIQSKCSHTGVNLLSYKHATFH